MFKRYMHATRLRAERDALLGVLEKEGLCLNGVTLQSIECLLIGGSVVITGKSYIGNCSFSHSREYFRKKVNGQRRRVKLFGEGA